MKICLFYQSLISDWNHGNAHFLRGIVSELRARRHEVVVYEPRDAWSVQNLLAEHGRGPIRRFQAAYPKLKSVRYDLKTFNVARAVAGADLVLVHEWNPPALIEQVGEARRKHNFVLLFHDTHHRLVTDRTAMRAFDFTHFDGVLAYGEVLRRLYASENLARRVWTWHEAADARRFRPVKPREDSGDLVWVGNWGDDERTEELMEFLIKPVKTLGLKARVYGVRYPDQARAALADAGIEYGGWLANFDVPDVFAQFKMTVHIPRRPYVKSLPGIPTIRPFEALACGIPLVCSPWRDAERLFTPGKDFLVARTGAEMTKHLAALAADETKRRALAEHGLATIRARHTCAHRVQQLMEIYAEVMAERDAVVVPATKLFRRKASLAAAAAAS
jgi:spore maturation protein CgeB